MVKFVPFTNHTIDPTLIYSNPTQIVQKDVDKLRMDSEKAFTIMENDLIVLNDENKKMTLVITELHKHCENIDLTNASLTDIIQSLNKHIDALEYNISETVHTINHQHKDLHKRLMLLEDEFAKNVYRIDNSDMSMYAVIIIGLIGIMCGIMMYNMGI